eukprot:GHVR01051424.1.p1 GENE.GHVR01051424.1~~GHVR01051424.1.p1  ORF type:complete len:183 (-),score=13.20 GHVR01051424.1:1161-1709(-)
MAAKSRIASFSGSWYPGDPVVLQKDLEEYLTSAETIVNNVKAVIVPHAGYSYCGEVAAWSFKHVDPTNIDRVFVLGPSHHKYMDTCALPDPSVKQYETPLGPLFLDENVLSELQSVVGPSQVPVFSNLNLEEDHAELSLEMMLPFLAHVFKGKGVSLVPIVVGSLSPQAEEFFCQCMHCEFK